MHHARTNLATALQRAGNLLQECVAALNRQGPGGAHDGVKFGIGKADGWHGRASSLRGGEFRAMVVTPVAYSPCPRQAAACRGFYHADGSLDENRFRACTHKSRLEPAT